MTKFKVPTTCSSIAMTAFFVCLVFATRASYSDSPGTADAAKLEAVNPVVLMDQVVERDRLQTKLNEIDFRKSVAQPPNRPVATEYWRGIHQGEFESDEVFKRRQESARAEEAKKFTESVATWRTAVRAAETQAAPLNAERREVMKQIDALKLLRRDEPDATFLTSAVNGQLSVFDRSQRAFPPINVNIHIEDSPYRDDQKTLFQINTSFAMIIAIKDLDVAKKFKQDWADGKLSLRCVIKPATIVRQSPIIMTQGTTEVKTEKIPASKEDIVGRALGAIIVASIVGADASNSNFRPADVIFAPTEKSTVVEHPAVTREGTRYVVAAEIVSASVIDTSGKPVAGVTITVKGSETADRTQP